MQLTRQSEYAIRALLELAAAPEGVVIKCRTIAEKHGMPEKFLNKTVQVLVRAGLVRTRRGMQGGIRLAVPPETITMADVIDIIEGRIVLNPCLGDNYSCKNINSCLMHGILQRTQDAMVAELSKETFADLAREEVKAKILGIIN